MEFELFSVRIKTDGTVKIEFNEDLAKMMGKDRLNQILENKTPDLIPIVQSIANLLSTESEE